MTAPTDSSIPEVSPGTGLAGLAGRLARVTGAVADRRNRWREIAEMRSLSDAYLRDIGISRFGIAWNLPHGDGRAPRRTS